MVESENLYSREFIEQLPGGIIILDSKKRIEFLNKEITRILGKSSKKTIGKDFKDVFKEISRNTFEYEKYHGKKVTLRGKLQKMEDTYFGCFMNVSDLDRYKDLFDGVPAGVYRVNKNNNIIMANDEFAKIFGYNSAKEVFGRNVSEFYQSENDMKKFIEILNEEGSIMDYELDMKKKDGQKIIISASSSLIEDENEDQIEREGTILDVTKKTEYLRALEEMPTGYYEVQHKSSGKHEIIKCNAAFAELFGYSLEEMIGMDISDLYANKEEKEKFMKILREKSKKNQDLKDYELKARKEDGAEFYIEIDCHLIKNTRNREIGRRGTVRDITHKVQLTKTLDDMDKFVHQYVTPLINIEISTEALINLLELITNITYKRAKLINPSKRMGDEFADMLEGTMPLLKNINIPYKTYTDIESHLYDIKERKEIFKEDDVSLMDLWTREHIFYILNKLRSISENPRLNIPENIHNRLKKVEEKGRYILQLYALQQQQRIFSTTKLTHNVIESMRSYLVMKKEREYDFKEENIYKIINDNIELLYPYAQQKGLIFKYKGEKNVKTLIAGEHFDRVISNLLMNAIKYSYTREGGYIEINVEDDGKEVKIKISNYGVPIRSDELGKVFEYGYRGVFSQDWNRMGSGIGLADAQRVIEKHGGKIEIESNPSRSGFSGNYEIPYITTVKVYIPKKRGSEK
ncbi:MAG: PAS domain S-box protein [Candidatus Methanofastidiosia archaeon]|jgi:PAS domain S-box-containing protein